MVIFKDIYVSLRLLNIRKKFRQIRGRYERMTVVLQIVFIFRYNLIPALYP